MIPAAIRLRGLLRKEMKHVVRDPSAMLIAFVMPLVLLLVLGFGISFDANHMPIALVADAPEQEVRGLIQAMDASPYLSVQRANSVHAAEIALAAGQVRGIVVVRQDFMQHLSRYGAWPATAGLDLNATDPNTARVLEGYVSGALEVWLAGRAQEQRLSTGGQIDLQVRYWFNPELRSADAIVPGVIAMVMTMAGTLLTAGGVSREWEHGTMESLLASPAHMGEMILARLGCNFLLGIGSMLVSLLLAIFLFHVPFRGGFLPLAIAVAFFLVFALGWGLFISTVSRNQFVASQISFLTTMMPAMMLSGMVYDIAAMPHWLQLVTYLVPARYLVSILQTMFLAGDVWPVILPNLAALAAAATLAVAGTVLVTRRRLD
ncbi:MAG TPA: ABC transporter permease [Acetobacteraceae bacterium]|nr:ABC transporter permease [Acetobacteraceae bacterium]